ncbi:MAG: ribonuclease Z [Clostridia bacterium]|nr:ribonuclease Z [Clostridia bacterium]
MKLIVCLDDKNGMAFNRRRQSRDRVLIEDLCRTVGEEPIYLSPYSASLFASTGAKTVAVVDPLGVSGVHCCFVETFDPAPYGELIDEIILYRWNRHYPADVTFTLDMSGYRLISADEFVGSSHEKITKEVWKK